MNRLKTRLPWRYERRDERWPFHHCILDANGYVIAGCFSEESAKHIVRCVNIANKALDACKAVVAIEAERQEVIARDGRPDDLWAVPPDAKWYRHALQLAREALETSDAEGRDLRPARCGSNPAPLPDGEPLQKEVTGC